MNVIENAKAKAVLAQADIILKKEISENSYYEYMIGKNKKAYFQGYEDGHGMDGTKTKELRRTAFFIDFSS